MPDDCKYALHVLLVEHGKRCVKCAKGGKLQLPSEGDCPLVNFQEKIKEQKGSLLLLSPSSKQYVPWYLKVETCETVKPTVRSETSDAMEAKEPEAEIKVEIIAP